MACYASAKRQLLASRRNPCHFSLRARPFITVAQGFKNNYPSGRHARSGSGGGSVEACHVVYIALNETRADLEAFASTAAASRSICWWAMPIRNSASYGERARKLLEADAMPCVVVTRWSRLAASSGTGGGGGFVEILNENAARRGPATTRRRFQC